MSEVQHLPLKAVFLNREFRGLPKNAKVYMSWHDWTLLDSPYPCEVRFVTPSGWTFAKLKSGYAKSLLKHIDYNEIGGAI